MATSTSAESELCVRNLLESAGFSVERIAPDEGRTADFLVADDVHRYLVEVTEKLPRRDYRDFKKSLDAEGAAFLHRREHRDPRVDDALGDKADQLRRTPLSADFNVIAVVAFNEDADHELGVWFRTLFGVADLRAVASLTCETVAHALAVGSADRLCFYYDHPSFMDQSDVSGVAFVSQDKVCLFVNPFAPTVPSFRSARLCKEFAARNSLVDPERQADADTWFLDGAVDRSDEQAKHIALRLKYGMFTQRSQEVSLLGMISIPTVA